MPLCPNCGAVVEVSVPDKTLAMKVANEINEHLASDRELGALQSWEISSEDPEFARSVWAHIPQKNRDRIRALNNERYGTPKSDWKPWRRKT